MQDIRTTEGDTEARDLRFAIVASRFNEFIVASLIRGAVEALERHGAKPEHVELIRVPGALELPVVIRKLLAQRRFDAIIALGAVIRGETAHFQYVAGECARGLAQLAIESGVPIAFGVLTTETIEQAMERAGTKSDNKGAEAAVTAIEMANLLRHLDG
ncbi:MAG TPA: 6,7-dimethyl-8-ribityllumazine synthase [Steroidobacteraceae bacterium]